MRRLTATAEEFPIAGAFRISRESRTIARVVTAQISDGAHTGRGECVPYPRYGESVEGVVADIESMADQIAEGMDHEALRASMKAGAARNAIDCALYDYEAKRTGVRVADRLGVDMRPLTTALTLSIGAPEEMADAARAAGRPLLKVKLGSGEEDAARIAAVRAAAPDATLIVDANEGWSEAVILKMLSVCADNQVALVEQPLPARRDGLLATISHPVPVCADESVHTSAELGDLRRRYDAVNVKLDKAGGLTEALTMVSTAKELGFSVMLGCMVGTSLGMAPALLAAQEADFVDLDGPLLLAEDRSPALVYDGDLVYPPEPELWG